MELAKGRNSFYEDLPQEDFGALEAVVEVGGCLALVRFEKREPRRGWMNWQETDSSSDIDKFQLNKSSSLSISLSLM